MNMAIRFTPMCGEIILTKEGQRLGRKSNNKHIFTLILKDHKVQLKWFFEMAK